MTPVRKTVAFTSVRETHCCETEDSTDAEEATPSPGDDAEELRYVEVCLFLASHLPPRSVRWSSCTAKSFLLLEPSISRLPGRELSGRCSGSMHVWCTVVSSFPAHALPAAVTAPSTGAWAAAASHDAWCSRGGDMQSANTGAAGGQGR